jgi:hypothetical protein
LAAFGAAVWKDDCARGVVEGGTWKLETQKRNAKSAFENDPTAKKQNTRSENEHTKKTLGEATILYLRLEKYRA